jgi:hypothetical protein
MAARSKTARGCWRERDAQLLQEEKGHFMGTTSQESMLRSALSDPLVRLVMEADGVDPRALEAMLMATASRIRRRRHRRELAIGVDASSENQRLRGQTEAAAQALARRVRIQRFTGEANG